MTLREIPVWTIPASSVEWVGPIEVKVNGVAVDSFQLAVRPADGSDVELDWKSPTVLDDQDGLLLGSTDFPALTRGDYWIEATYQADPETPVLDRVGLLVIT